MSQNTQVRPSDLRFVRYVNFSFGMMSRLTRIDESDRYDRIVGNGRISRHKPLFETLLDTLSLHSLTPAIPLKKNTFTFGRKYNEQQNEFPARTTERNEDAAEPTDVNPTACVVGSLTDVLNGNAGGDLNLDLERFRAIAYHLGAVRDKPPQQPTAQPDNITANNPDILCNNNENDEQEVGDVKIESDNSDNNEEITTGVKNNNNNNQMMMMMMPHS